MAVHSKLSVVKMDTHLGVLTTISTYCNKCEVPRELEEIDVTTFGATTKAFLSGFSEGTVSLAGPWSRALDQFMSPIFAAFEAGTLSNDATLSFEYGPEGTDTGDVRYQMELGMMRNWSGAKADIGNAQMWDAEFRIYGTATVSVY